MSAPTPNASESRHSPLDQLRRSFAHLLGGTFVHRFYSYARGLSYSSGGARGRTATEHLQHGLALDDRDIEAGRHRRLVGGRWDEIGRLQLDFLVREGLEPGDRVLDVGCGALRAGVHLVAFLEPGHYFGIDINPSLIRAGLWELDQAGLEDRCLPTNLRATEAFDCDFGVQFDVALAQSLYTHISLAQIGECLGHVAAATKPGGRFFASYNGLPPGKSLRRPSTHDPFRHAFDDLGRAGGDDWDSRYVADWGHPRGMKMIEYRRR
jgi:SAM-dependent methyltransferase